MPRFKKVVLKPGTYESPDGRIEITPARINHWVEQHKKMVESGIRVPVPWGHNSLAHPKTNNEKEYLESKFNAGFIEQFINEDDSLVAFLDIPRAEDAERVGTVVQEVSPQVESVWRDGKGRIWSDVLTHLALVTQPVVPNQENFQPIDDPVPAHALRLSLSKLINMKIEDKPMADKEDKKPNPFEKADDKPTEKKEDKPEDATTDVSTPDGGEGTEVDSDLLSLLAEIGLVIPEGLSGREFMVALKASAMTLKQKMDEMEAPEMPMEQSGLNDDDLLKQLTGDKDKPEGQETEKPEKPDEKEPLQEQQPAMTMSLSNKDNKEPNNMSATTPDTDKNLLDENMKNVQLRLSLTEKKLEDSEKKNLLVEINNLLEHGKITPIIAEKLREGTKTFKMSLKDDGTTEMSWIQAQIDTLKLLPEGAAWSEGEKTRLRSVSEESLPVDFKNLSEDDSEKIAEQQLKATGRGLAF